MSAFRDRFNRLRGSVGAEAEGAVPAAVEIHTPEQILDGAPAGEAPEAAAPPTSDHAVPEQTALPEWEPYGVRLVRHEAGEFLLKETRFPITHRHGIHAFTEWTAAAPSLAAFHGDELVIGPDPCSADEMQENPPVPHDVLFLDLETTGLGVGAGNVPFMLGISYFEGNEYVVRQSLIRHPAEERAMLADLKDRLPQFRYLVTYNGRTFDWPLVQSRFILNGFGSRVWEPLHLDFLHPSRTIWRNTLVSCKLSRVEEERLGVFRQDDLPGSEAPGRYFAYLADGNPEPLADVFRHNEIDMLSLAALAIRFGHLLAGHIGQEVPVPTEPEELVRTGLWLEKMGAVASAEPLLHSVRGLDHAPPSVWNRLAERDKRLGLWEEAVSLWRKSAAAAEQTGIPSTEAHIELSMYFEHRTKEISFALAYARAALELALQHPLSGRANSKRRKEIDALRHRIDRLVRKAAKS
ncbi:conserved hypothetical protein [Paenibacillus curdlanolyticus YK9]|uniref:YprB ribonuclease H-like domain-containing protein n=1 Tax=Paenibacillus curdlanolyticus YK9 TaxID=717606 RepID=E0I546_9BACL|nr:ribonuclease H-like domain-containing protein [Paenibacillus curdlanolyticus]EFM12088.1 conserved hypothetical protein [Paenibacillus curdlanolyticus YK9]